MLFRRRPNSTLFMTLAMAFSFMVPLSSAELNFSPQFSDHMVLQRGESTTLRGLAPKGAKVEISFARKVKTSTADANGIWSVVLDPLSASSAPMSLIASSGGSSVTLNDIVIGDVFLVARQTSIDINLGSTEIGKKAASSHLANPNFRSLAIVTQPSYKPQALLSRKSTQGWNQVSQTSALHLTAASYYFGRDLSKTSDVPVGIIDLNMGYQFPISWLSRETLANTKDLYGSGEPFGLVKTFDHLIDLKDKGEPMPKKAYLESGFDTFALSPMAGYNAVIEPMKGLGLKAILLQLGNDYPYMIYDAINKSSDPFNRQELDRAYVQTYSIRKKGYRMEPVTLPQIPREWRKAFGNDDLPIGLITPPGSDLNTLGQHHREMRELHRQTAEAHPNMGIILAGSEHIPFSSQPADEALLAKRSLSWVRGAVLGTDTTPTGPLFDRMEANFNKATVHFKKGTAKGLKAHGDALNYFEVASLEGDYSPATASIDGDVIRIKSNTINRISRVRYNWNHHPDQGLVNDADLPAIPFSSEKVAYQWFVTNKDDDLPIEYSTPANEWEKNDVTLINGQLKTHGYNNFTGWLGPIGARVGPFGPNMGVREIKENTPAFGKLFVGDVIYSANGKMLGEKAWMVMANAITDSESETEGGKLLLGLRRDGENLDIELHIKVMGTYSSTAPFDCPKTDKIISELENWVIGNGAEAGFLNTDALFLLSTGNPKMLPYVKRIVYGIIKKMDPNQPIDPQKAGKSWANSAGAILLGEYFHATGDQTVLPYLKNFCDRLAATQNEEYGGWRHNYPGGATYGLIPNAGLPGVMGMHLAKIAGVDINLEAFEKGVQHFSKNRGETGYLIYGFGKLQRDDPHPFKPHDMETGHMQSANGGLSASGILMRFVGNYRGAHLCSLISSYAWNSTFHGHGGNFWNNFWTPLGSFDHGREMFINFWTNHRWYREVNRNHNGSLIINGQGDSGAGTGVALAAPRRKLQITGAPPSPFSVDAPESLKLALEAHQRKDYSTCERLVKELLASGTVPLANRPTVEALGSIARYVRKSETVDLTQAKATFKSEDSPKEDQAEVPRQWESLTTEIETNATKANSKGIYTQGKVPPEEANTWRIKVVESLDKAPENWTAPDFDDSSWQETYLPISWRMYHTSLLRTTFHVEDPSKFDLLRFRGWVFRQQGIEISLNGTLIGKVNNIEKKTGNIVNDFKPSALKLLKKGENTLAVTSRHNWRWGMLFMKVYNDGFGFRLDGRLAE